MREETHSRSLSAVDCCCFDVADCRLSVLNNDSRPVTVYRLIDRAVRHKTSLHVMFPEWRPTLPIVRTKYRGSYTLGQRDSSDLISAQNRTWSCDVRTPTMQCVNKGRARRSYYLSANLSQSQKNGSYKLRAEKAGAWVSYKRDNLIWLAKKKKNKKNNMFIERDWLNRLVDRVKTKLGHSSWPSMSLHPIKLGVVVFINGDANMNNSGWRKRMYPYTGLRATCLSRLRKRIRFWRLRVTLDER